MAAGQLATEPALMGSKVPSADIPIVYASILEWCHMLLLSQHVTVAGMAWGTVCAYNAAYRSIGKDNRTVEACSEDNMSVQICPCCSGSP